MTMDHYPGGKDGYVDLVFYGKAGAKNDDYPTKRYIVPFDPYFVSDICSAAASNCSNSYEPECIVTAIGTPVVGREDECLLAAKLRSVMVLQQPCCRWVDSSSRIYSESDGLLRILHTACWSNANARCLFNSSWASEEFYRRYGDMFQDMKMKLYERICNNPFHNFGQKSQISSSTTQMLQKFNPLLFGIQQYAYSVLIEISPKQKCQSLFMKLLFASEACAPFERGCMRYIIMKEKEMQRRRDRLFVYGVFVDENAFIYHSQQGYSILGERFDEVCYNRPVVLTFTRSTLVTNQSNSVNF